MFRSKFITILLFIICAIGCIPSKLFAISKDFDAIAPQGSGFTLVKKEYIPSESANAYYLKHSKSGANVFYLDNSKNEKTFSIGFKTPPSDNNGANHVLEHGLMRGSIKYPSKDLGTYLRGASVATMINAFTYDDSTCYAFKTSNKADFYNLADVYINAVLNPNILTDENIFKQQGIRKEYTNGKVNYNGIVYNELRLKNKDTGDNALNFVADKLYTNLYGNTVPAFNSGGTTNAIKALTYSDVKNVYKKYYTPSNSLICISGNQDITKTLTLLNSYLKNYDNKNQSVSLDYSPLTSKEAVKSYNITDKTKKVDIGFLYSGPKVTMVQEAYTYEVLVNVLHKRLTNSYPKNYIIGGNSGGISTLGTIVSEVAANQKDKAITQYKAIINSLLKSGISKTELDLAIAEVENNRNFFNITRSSDLAMNGFVYGDNPFLFLNHEVSTNNLRDNPSYIKEILEKYFINNPHKSIVISGPVPKVTDNDDIKVSKEELQKIKKDTTSFNSWAETPDTPEVLAKLPSLSLDDFSEDCFNKKHGRTERIEIQNSVHFYATIDDSSNISNANIYFRLPQIKENLEYSALITQYLNTEFAANGLNKVQCILEPCENFTNENKTNPLFVISVSVNKTEIAEISRKIFTILKDKTLFSEEKIKNFLLEELKRSKLLTLNPYNIAYDMIAASQNQGDKFRAYTLGCSETGSIFYFNFIKDTVQNIDKTSGYIQILNSVFQDMLNRNKLIIGYNGNSHGYNTFKSIITPFLAQINEKTKAAYTDTIKLDYPSAIILSDKQDVSQVLQAGNIYKSGYQYSGKLEVLSKLLTTKYLTPILRNKMGAYGTDVSFSNGKTIFSVDGANDVDKAIDVFTGAANYLRNITITQKELNNIIISTLSQFDEDYNSDNYLFEQEALTGCTIDNLKKIRTDILNTTVADMKNYANFIDAMTSQKNIFVIANSVEASKISFPFKYIIDSSSLTIKPR